MILISICHSRQLSSMKVFQLINFIYILLMAAGTACVELGENHCFTTIKSCTTGTKLLHKLPHIFCLSHQAWPVKSWYSTHPVSSCSKHHPIITILPQAIVWFPVWKYQHVAKHRISFLIFFKFNCICTTVVFVNSNVAIVNKGIYPYTKHWDLWTFSMSWNIN